MKNEVNMEKENFINQKKFELEKNDAAIKENKGIFGIIKSIFEQSSKESLEDEFFSDFYKKYPKLEFEEYENLEVMKEDFFTIFWYDKIYDSSYGTRYAYNLKQINKVKIDNKNAYIGHMKYNETKGDCSFQKNNLNLLMKMNLDGRLYIFTKENLSKKEDFEYTFINKEQEILEYDKDHEDELKEELSDDYYFSRFSVNSDAQLLSLDENTKQKLTEIFNKHGIQFYISLKDNLLRINVEIPSFSFDSRYGILYEIEKTFEELIKIFLELERTSDMVRFKKVEKEYNGIKNIIFDLDNTIILDTEEDSECYRNVLINAGYPDDYFYGIYQGIDEYDKTITEENPYYNEKDMLEFLNEYLEQEFSIEVIEGLKESVGKEWTKRVLISKKTLEYLASKYNLYIYTNYYQEAQVERIKNIGYEKYFKKIFGADKYGVKQFKSCFENVLKEIGTEPNECIMIGDDKSRDIVAANNVNMKSILFDYNGRRDKKDVNVKNYFIIKDMKELEKIL